MISLQKKKKFHVALYSDIVSLQKKFHVALYSDIVSLQKKFHVALYSDIYWFISHKLGLTIETTMLFILIPVWITMTFSQSYSYIEGSSPEYLSQLCNMLEIPFWSRTLNMKNQNVCPGFQADVAIDWEEIQYVATTFWFVEAHAGFILHDLYSRERTKLTWFYEIYF